MITLIEANHVRDIDSLAGSFDAANLTKQEQRLLDAFRTMDGEYAIRFLTVGLMVAEEHPAQPAPQLRLVTPVLNRTRRRR
jgi:hypothetical protein